MCNPPSVAGPMMTILPRSVLKQRSRLHVIIWGQHNVVTSSGIRSHSHNRCENAALRLLPSRSPRRQRAQRSATSPIRALHRFQLPRPVCRSRLLAEAWPHETHVGARARSMLVPLYRRSLSMPTTGAATTLAWSCCKCIRCMRAAGRSLPRSASLPAPRLLRNRSCWLRPRRCIGVSSPTDGAHPHATWTRTRRHAPVVSRPGRLPGCWRAAARGPSPRPPT